MAGLGLRMAPLPPLFLLLPSAPRRAGASDCSADALRA
eukprot:gene28836-61097_t